MCPKEKTSEVTANHAGCIHKMSKANKIYNHALNLSRRKAFLFFQKMGLHLTPNHFYIPIPDTRKLKMDLWKEPSDLNGIDINEEEQIKLLAMFSSKFKDEYEKIPRDKTSIPHQYYLNNGAFESVDAEILYCMIRHFKPRKVFEIGSGYSTLLAAQAVLKNEEEGYDNCELIAFEPYPNDTLKSGFHGLSKLVTAKIQDVPSSRFNELNENDILFIDSSHVLMIGSDVQYEYLNIMPKLKKGVLVHIHDIFLPAEYPKEWILEDFRFWNEQYLLQAFLIYNQAFEVLWMGNYMNLMHSNELEAAFSSYKKGKISPGSFWMRKKI